MLATGTVIRGVVIAAGILACVASAAPRASAGTACIPPANDNFADEAELITLPFAASGDTACATLQVSEPHACASAGATVWYRYTPSEDQTLEASTAGSDYDTSLSVYTGPGLGSLSSVACDDDSGPGLTSLITFAAQGDTMYHIQVGGFAGSTGLFQFHLAPPLPTPTPTSTPVPTDTPTPCLPCTATPTVTPTPTSIRPIVTAFVDETVNGQQGPVTVVQGATVIYRWVITDSDPLGRAFGAWVTSVRYTALSGTCVPYVECQHSVEVTLLTPGPVTDSVSAIVCPSPPSPYCSGATDYVKVNVVTPSSVGGVSERPDATALPSATSTGQHPGGAIAGVISLITVGGIAAIGWYVWRMRAA